MRPRRWLGSLPFRKWSSKRMSLTHLTIADALEQLDASGEITSALN